MQTPFRFASSVARRNVGSKYLDDLWSILVSDTCLGPWHSDEISLEDFWGAACYHY